MQLIMPPYGRRRDGSDGFMNGPQAAFHDSHAPFKLFLGGVGSGKSHCGARELILHALTNGPGLMYLVGAPTHAILEDASFRHCVDFLNEIAMVNGHALHTKVLSSPQNRRIELVNGAIIRFISLDDPDRYAGPTIAGAWIDEGGLLSNGEKAWFMFLERLRDNKAGQLFILVTTTPRGPVGIVQLFLDAVGKNNPDYELFTASTFDNEEALGKEYIHRMMQGRSKREVDQQVRAHVLAFEGAVYANQYDRVESIARWWKAPGDPTVIKAPGLKYPKPRMPYIDICQDWGPNHPHTLFVEGCTTTHVDVIFDEVCEDHVQPEEVIRRTWAALRERWQIEPSDVNMVYCDHWPKGARQLAQTMWARFGVGVEHRRVRNVHQVTDGIDVVASRLCDYNGDRRLLIAPRMIGHGPKRRMEKCLLLYQWTEVLGQSERGFSEERPIKSIYSNGPDALRYREWTKNSHWRWARDSTGDLKQGYAG